MDLMHAKIVIRPALPREGQALVAMSRRGFGRAALGMWRGMGRAGVTLVALRGERLVGFGCFTRVEDLAHEGELTALLHCLRPPVRSLLAPLPYDALGAAAMVVTAPDGVQPTLSVGDCVLTASYVEPDHRRRGLGTALARERLAVAAAAGARQVFVHCIRGAGSRGLYERLGFTALLEVQRHYEDGRGMTLMHRLLEPAPPLCPSER